MINGKVLLRLMVSALIVSSCSITISQTTPIIPSPQIETVPTAPPPAVGPTQPVATSTNSLPVTTVPVTWAHLNLSGKLVYINGAAEDNSYILSVRILDLVKGSLTTIFKSPKNRYSWIYYVSVSPDSKQLVMSYSPPYQDNPDIYQALYIMPLDGSSPPQLLFQPPAKDDQYDQPEWSPDGRYIYYTHINYQSHSEPDQVYPFYEIFRMTYPDGEPEKLVEQAYWPRLSPDSSQMVYISVDPFSLKNKLMISDADGSNAREIVLSGDWNPDIKDAPIFSPDGQSIILSAASQTPSLRPNWLDRIMAVRIAKADGMIPSEWWSVPIAGGELTQLTHIRSIGLFASISPDMRHIASASGNGIFVMKPDGSELTSLLPDEIGSGTVSSIP